MPQQFAVYQQSPSISVIQQAYELLVGESKVTFHNSGSGFASSAVRTKSKRHKGMAVIHSGMSYAVSSSVPVPMTVATIGADWVKFKRLVSAWRMERGAMSSITEAVLRPAYQSIIGMGEPAIQFLIQQLKTEGADPDQWFWALKAITGVDPVKEADRGNYRKMAQSWTRWAKQEGYGR